MRFAELQLKRKDLWLGKESGDPVLDLIANGAE